MGLTSRVLGGGLGLKTLHGGMLGIIRDMRGSTRDFGKV